jgi:hypothetical protein
MSFSSYLKQNGFGELQDDLDRLVTKQGLSQDELLLGIETCVRKARRKGAVAEVARDPLSDAIVNLNRGVDVRRSANVVRTALAEGSSQMARSVLERLAPSVLLDPDASSVTKKLYEQRSKAFIEKYMIPLIEAFNEGPHAKEASAWLDAFVSDAEDDEAEALAGDISARLRPSVLTRANSDDLFTTLLDQDSEAFVKALYPVFCQSLNQDREPDYCAEWLDAMIEEDSDWADPIRRHLDPALLPLKAADGLLRRLFDDDSERFTEWARRPFIERLDDPDERSLAAAWLETIVNEDSDQAVVILRGLEADALSVPDNADLLEALYNTDAEAFGNTLLPHFVDAFSKDEEPSATAADWLTRLVSDDCDYATKIVRRMTDGSVFLLATVQPLAEALYDADADVFYRKVAGVFLAEAVQQGAGERCALGWIERFVDDESDRVTTLLRDTAMPDVTAARYSALFSLLYNGASEAVCRYFVPVLFDRAAEGRGSLQDFTLLARFVEDGNLEPERVRARLGADVLEKKDAEPLVYALDRAAAVLDKWVALQQRLREDDNAQGARLSQPSPPKRRRGFWPFGRNARD